MADRKKWAVMIYLAGNNNLAEECVWSLTEITRAFKDNAPEAAKDEIRVYTQFDSPVAETRQIRITMEGSTLVKEELEKMLDDPAKVGNLSYQRMLRNFVTGSVERDPRQAGHHLLILSGHGSGTEGDFLESGDRALTVRQLHQVFLEDDPDNNIRKSLQKAGKEEAKIDILGMDSCLMSMIEVGYQLRDHVKILVGAEGFAANTGWPYYQILNALLEDKDQKDPEQLAARFVTEYTSFYRNYTLAGRSVDLAALRLNRCDTLAAAIKVLAKALMESLPTKAENEKYEKTGEISDPFKTLVRNAVLLAHWEAQSYKDDQFVDLYDFCDLLGRRLKELSSGQPSASQPGKIINACQIVKDEVRAMVIKSCYSGAAVQYSHGLSVYFPWAEPSEHYAKLAFADEEVTSWYSFLKRCAEATRRAPRPGKDDAERKSGARLVGLGDSENRSNPPLSKSNPPLSKLLDNQTGSMKNPPLEYYECECSVTVSLRTEPPR